MVQMISEIEDHGVGRRPLIVTFQNSEIEKDEGTMQTGIYQSHKQSVVAVATNNNLYVGEVNKEDDDSKESFNRFLLISNRITGKVRLVAVDSAKVVAQFSAESQPDDTLNNSSAVNQPNFNQLKEFSTKKTKRKIEQQERLKMNIEDVRDQLEQTVAMIDVNESESLVEGPSENDSVYRPPINRQAATKEEVYVLHDMVPEHVLDSLKEEATYVLSSDLENIDLTPFIKNKVLQLQSSSIDNVIGKTELLLYVDYMIKYIGKPAKNITKRFVLCQSSTEVNNHILNNFSVVSNAGRARPLSMRDKTICYILVLSLIAFNYELDLEAISKVVKLGIKKLQEICRILAFSSSAKNKNMIVLKMPLPSPVSVSARKRKRTA